VLDLISIMKLSWSVGMLRISCAHEGATVRVCARAVDNKSNGFRHGTDPFGRSPAKSPVGAARWWPVNWVGRHPQATAMRRGIC